MAGRIFGYARRSVWKAALTLEGQREAITGYAAARGLPFVVERGFFADNPISFKEDFPDRPAGKILWENLGRGDHLIVSSLDRLFVKLSDCDLALRCWHGLGVALHLADVRRPLEEIGATFMTAVLANMEQAGRSERAAYTAARSRYYGRPVNGNPPYGFQWVRRPRTREWKLLPDEEERAIMKKLLEWHEAGQSFDQIRQILDYRLKVRFYKQRGRKKRLVRWNNDAIWRRIKAEERLQGQESQAACAGSER
jgi:DNA invertase Pin-like site-specific DNA recombinase